MRSQKIGNDPKNYTFYSRWLTNKRVRNFQLSDNVVSAASPPIVGYTGHIPGAKGEVALSKRYGLAAKRGLELLERDRRSRVSSAKDANDAAHQRVLDVTNLDETGHAKP